MDLPSAFYGETSIRWPSLAIGAALVAAAAADFLIPLDSPGNDIARPLALAAPGMLLLLWSLTRRRVRIDSRRLRLGRRSIELADLDPASVAKARSEATSSDEQRRRAHAPAPSADQITEMVNDLAACRDGRSPCGCRTGRGRRDHPASGERSCQARGREGRGHPVAAGAPSGHGGDAGSGRGRGRDNPVRADLLRPSRPAEFGLPGPQGQHTAAGLHPRRRPLHNNAARSRLECPALRALSTH